MILKNDTLQATISTIGAELSSLRINNDELIWQGKHGFWPGKAMVLFPICGFLKNGFYIHQGKKYKMPVHGFASSQVFTVESHSTTKMTLSLVNNDETYHQYPFEFKLTLVYEIMKSSITISYTIENTSSNVTLPCSFGWHPGFNCDNECYLQFDKDHFSRRSVTKDGLIGNSTRLRLKNNLLLLNGNTFKNGGIVLENFRSDVTLVTPHYKVVFDTREFPNLVLWGQPGADFVCIEPWQGMGDTTDHTNIFTEKEQLLRIKPDGQQSTKLTMSVMT